MGLMVSVPSLKPDLCQDPYEGLNEGLSGRNHTRQPTDVGSYHLELHLNVAEKGACQVTETLLYPSEASAAETGRRAVGGNRTRAPDDVRSGQPQAGPQTSHFHPAPWVSCQ